MLRNIIQHGLRTRIRSGSIIGSSVRIKPNLINQEFQKFHEGFRKMKTGIKVREFHTTNVLGSSNKNMDGEKDVGNDEKKKKSDSGDKKVKVKEESSDSVLDVAIPIELGRKIDGELIKNYVDTLHIFNELKKLGFKPEQSDLILQLINENLTYHINKMNEKFTTSMEMENESYLFEAAQSELRIEINTSRELDLHTLENEKNSMDLLLNQESEELNNL